MLPDDQGAAMIGPLPRWSRVPAAHRICRASARIMRLAMRLRGLWLTRHEITLALQAVLSAVESKREGEG